MGQVPISMQNPGCDIFIDIFNYSRRSRNLKGAIDIPSLVQLQRFVHFYKSGPKFLQIAVLESLDSLYIRRIFCLLSSFKQNYKCLPNKPGNLQNHFWAETFRESK